MMLHASLPTITSVVMDVVAAFGCVQAAVGATLLRRFETPPSGKVRDAALPPVTVLKPLHGDEPLLEEALSSFCTQDYPEVQIVFGVQSRTDSAIALVERLQARFPELDLVLVVDGTPHGANRKIANLINMLPASRHDVLVISDSDIHAEPNYLRQVVAALETPGTGLVTTLYGGRPASLTLSRRLAAGQINHNFLPGVLMSRLLGRQDCLGATMALRRETLDAIGGLPALSPHVADDSALGRLVRAHGQGIAVARTMTITTIAEGSLRDLFAHELRWGRTVRTVEPVGYALSAIQLPLFWASAALLLQPGRALPWLAFLLAWLVRALAANIIDRRIGQRGTMPALLLPLRDWLSAFVMLGSFSGRRVAWRGQMLHIAAGLPKRSGAALHAPLGPQPLVSGMENGD